MPPKKKQQKADPKRKNNVVFNNRIVINNNDKPKKPKRKTQKKPSQKKLASGFPTGSLQGRFIGGVLQRPYSLVVPDQTQTIKDDIRSVRDQVKLLLDDQKPKQENNKLKIEALPGISSPLGKMERNDENDELYGENPMRKQDVVSKNLEKTFQSIRNLDEKDMRDMLMQRGVQRIPKQTPGRVSMLIDRFSKEGKSMVSKGNTFNSHTFFGV